MIEINLGGISAIAEPDIANAAIRGVTDPNSATGTAIDLIEIKAATGRI